MSVMVHMIAVLLQLVLISMVDISVSVMRVTKAVVELVLVSNNKFIIIIIGSSCNE